MKKNFLFLAAAVMSLAAVAQTGLEPEQASHSDVLMTINGKAVSAEEFLYIYEKNNQAGAMDPKSMDEYLDMFINFKLKVAEAEAQGIDTTEAFKKELKGYRAQATPKYLQDEAALDSIIHHDLNWLGHGQFSQACLYRHFPKRDDADKHIFFLISWRPCSCRS